MRAAIGRSYERKTADSLLFFVFCASLMQMMDLERGAPMEAFTMEIAGLVCRVQPLFISTREYCRPYLTDKTPEFYVEVIREDLAYEQKMLDIEADAEGLKRRRFTDPFLERASIQRKIAQALLKADTLLFHGSTVGVDGAAYLFTAPCGTGKSTHTRFWRETLGSRAVMVNDDKAFLKITPHGVMAYGSPWTGKHGLGENISLPLKGICFLRRGTENRIWQAAPEACLSELRHQTVIPEGLQEKAFSLVDALAQKVALWQMECTKDPAAAAVSYAAMSGTGER